MSLHIRMKKTLTKKEEAAVARLKKAFDMLPDNLIVYVIDSSATVCKKGTPSYSSDGEMVCEHVGYVQPAAMLADMHDDMDFGREGGTEPHIRPMDIDVSYLQKK